MGLFKKVAKAAKSVVKKQIAGTKAVGKWVDKNGKQIVGGVMVAAGAVCCVTGVGSAVGGPLIAAGIGVATAKSKAAAKGAAINGAVSAVGASGVGQAAAGAVKGVVSAGVLEAGKQIATSTVAQTLKEKGSGIAEGVMASNLVQNGQAAVKYATEADVAKMTPKEFTAFSKFIKKPKLDLNIDLPSKFDPAKLEGRAIQGISKFIAGKQEITLSDAAQTTAINNKLSSAESLADIKQVGGASISNSNQKETKMNFFKKLWEEHKTATIIGGIVVLIGGAFAWFKLRKKGGRRF